jgi:hypothetical protein
LLRIAANPTYPGSQIGTGRFDEGKRVMPSSFLLPTCRFCDGPLSLSRIGPRIDNLEQRLFRCSECNAEQELPPPRLATYTFGLRR